MRNYFMMMLIIASTMSCAQESPKVSKVKPQHKTDLRNVKVVNAEDPICHMSTKDYLNEVAEFKNKKYGFCSISCKKEFLKNPSKYAKK